MPTFPQALSSKPGEFGDFGGAVNTAGSAVKQTSSGYKRAARSIEKSWTGDASDQFQQAARNAANAMSQVQTQLETTEQAAKAGGQMMNVTQKALETTKKSTETAGFRVLPAPFVMIGQIHIQQAQAAAPYGTAPIIAGYTATAGAITGQLVALTTTLTMQDVGTAATINATGLAMRMLAVALDGGNKALLPATKVTQDRYVRPGFRSDTVKDAWKKSKRDTEARQDAAGFPRDGMTYDPHDDDFSRGPLENRPSDVGHPPGWEFRDQYSAARLWGVRRSDFRNDYNHPDFIMEGQPENRSHRFESTSDELSEWIPYHFNKYGDPPPPSVPNVDYSKLNLGNA